MKMYVTRWGGVLAALMLETACGENDTGAGAGESLDAALTPVDAGAMGEGSVSRDAATSTSDAAVDVRAKIGEFSLQLVAAVPASGTTSDTPGFTALLGKVFDGPATEATLWETSASAEGCTLQIPRVPFCATACGSGAVCVADNTCKRAPVAIHAGTVTLSGVAQADGKATLSVEPVRNTYQTPGGVTLPFPAFLEGGAITLEASGLDVPAFRLEVAGIAPLTLGSVGAYALKKGVPLDITWQAASSTSSTLQVKLDISHHGGSKGKIECTVDDDGTLQIPAALTDKLLDLGVAGFPTVLVTRAAVGSTTTPLGRVDLRVFSSVERAIEIDGLVSCSAKEDCPAGHVCGEDLTCS